MPVGPMSRMLLLVARRCPRVRRHAPEMAVDGDRERFFGSFPDHMLVEAGDDFAGFERMTSGHSLTVMPRCYAGLPWPVKAPGFCSALPAAFDLHFQHFVAILLFQGNTNVVGLTLTYFEMTSISSRCNWWQGK